MWKNWNLAPEHKQLRLATLTILCCGAGLVLGLLAYEGGARPWFSWLTGWALVPFFALCHAALFLKGRGSATLVLIATILLVGFGLYGYFTATSPLAFLGIPFYQSLAILSLYLIYFVSRLTKRTKRSLKADERYRGV